MTSPRIRPVLAIGASLFVLAGASLLDVARMEPPQVAAARSDRLDVAQLAGDCTKNSLIAACAGSTQGSAMAMPPISLIQVFQKQAETTLVKVRLVN